MVWGAIYFTLFPNTNLPYTYIGAYDCNPVHDFIWKCGLGIKMFGLGIKMCGLGI